MIAATAARVVTPCRSCAPGEILARSALAAAGWHVVVRYLDDGDVAALATEASACHAEAVEHRTERPVDEAAGPRGQPARWLESAVGGDILQAFFHAPALLDHLRRLTGLTWRPSGEQGTYSYYRAAGHHLDLHCDVDECDLAVITCVQRSGADLPSLVLYPERAGEPFDALRATPAAGAVTIDLAAGESLVLLGGFVPHRLPPLAAGQVRVVAPLCFTPA